MGIKRTHIYDYTVWHSGSHTHTHTHSHKHLLDEILFFRRYLIYFLEFPFTFHHSSIKQMDNTVEKAWHV